MADSAALGAKAAAAGCCTRWVRQALPALSRETGPEFETRSRKRTDLPAAGSASWTAPRCAASPALSRGSAI
jgi:hypothetical protein